MTDCVIAEAVTNHVPPRYDAFGQVLAPAKGSGTRNVREALSAVCKADPRQEWTAVPAHKTRSDLLADRRAAARSLYKADGTTEADVKVPRARAPTAGCPRPHCSWHTPTIVQEKLRRSQVFAEAPEVQVRASRWGTRRYPAGSHTGLARARARRAPLASHQAVAYTRAPPVWETEPVASVTNSPIRLRTRRELLESRRQESLQLGQRFAAPDGLVDTAAEAAAQQQRLRLKEGYTEQPAFATKSQLKVGVGCGCGLAALNRASGPSSTMLRVLHRVPAR